MVSQKEQRQRKRGRDQFAGEESDSSVSAKRQRRSADNYPPDIWDNLSKITLTRKALREFDRRTRENRHPQAARVQETAPRLLRSAVRRLEHFARNGGPDLSKLRGYAALPSTEAAMYQSNSGTSKRQRDCGLAGSSFTGKTGTTGPYDPQFEQLLIDHGVYPDGYEDSNGNAPEPENIQAIRERLARSRSSLSPSHFDEAAFKQFQRTNRGVSTEQDVMEDVFPTIRGNTGTRFHKAGNTPFNNLVEFAPGITDAKVDGYDGARPMEIELAVRRDLHGYIIPSTRTDLPAAPNHLTEVKGPAGRSDVLRRQAMYAGAVGARGMFELQNYGSETPVYDGNAYALVPTYHAGEGSLRVYATHPRQSAVGQTEYHMTQLGSYAMTHSSESFRQGAAALRNSRDLSKEQRDRFIASANATARRLPPAATPSSGTAGGSPVSSRTEGASFESNTSTDEPCAELEEPPKRQRKRSAARSNVSGSVHDRGRQSRQQGSRSG
ncbi:hypothetical protein LTR48_004009 [Friedmanniomyces endolithicus]|uniref:Uncharacterized protein n=1 Tax=Rachicladosporium monterosium TaxID=1507873 RepID=A0ABR0LFD6_9PEZI|nr:hypothetical protein LTR48_004009 [Friedmanniomyces endolithicus]KAK5147950.1 hypothetical protein LTR32_000700 [Rachicladosporium monterosium]